MIYYSHTVIHQIKAAEDENALKEIILASVRDLQLNRRNGFYTKRGFILNMVMALKYLKAEGLTIRETGNVTMAIEILEKLRKSEQENLF